MPSFPTSVFSPTNKSAGQTIQAAHVNDLQDEVVAIEGGIRNGTAPINSSGSTVTSLSVTGDSTHGSTATFSGKIAAGSTTVSIGDSTTGFKELHCSSIYLGGVAFVPAITVLKSTSGTHTAGSAANVSTVTISGLTASDYLLIRYVLRSSSQTTANPVFYHATDGVTLAQTNGGNNLTAANGALTGTCYIMHDVAFGSTRAIARDNGTAIGSAPTGEVASGHDVSLTTALTSSWELALRPGAVTAGGTFHYRVTVHKVAGP
jgi:hypothetical protein